METGRFYSYLELRFSKYMFKIGLLTIFEIRIEYISLEDKFVGRQNSSSFINVIILIQIVLVNIIAIRN